MNIFPSQRARPREPNYDLMSHTCKKAKPRKLTTSRMLYRLWLVMVS